MTLFSNLPTCVQEQLHKDRQEVERLYRLTDPWLAKALLDLARKARQAASHLGPQDVTYDALLVWGLVPELARRLSASTRLEPAECQLDLRNLQGLELRRRVYYTLSQLASPLQHHTSWRLLTRDLPDGNPVVLALDRLAPGQLAERADLLAQRLLEVARARGCAFEGVWTPAFLPAEANS